MAIMMAVAAAVLSVPSKDQLLRLDDYPQWALREEASAAAAVRYVINPDGKIVQCTVSQTFGNSRLAKEICAIMRRRRLSGATSRDGASIQVVDQRLFQMFQPYTEAGKEIMKLAETPDAELQVNRLPGRSTSNVRVILHVDPSGVVVDCGAAASSQKDVDLVSVVCSQKAMFNGTIERDSAGRAAPYLTTKTVRFSVAANSKQ